MEKVLGGKIIIATAMVTFCCFLLWSGGSVITAVVFLAVVLLYIILPGCYIALLCGVREHLVATALPIGTAIFSAIYAIFDLTDVTALFYALPPLLGGIGLFTLIGEKTSIDIKSTRLVALPMIVFSVAVLPVVALPIFNAVPIADKNIFANAASLFESEITSLSPYNLIALAIMQITGRSAYEVLAFYLPIFSLVMLCITLYNLADRVLKNKKQALFATMIFFIATPFTYPGFDGGFFTAETLLTGGEFTLNLALAASVILSFERAVTTSSALRLVPAAIGYLILCYASPIFAGALLSALLPIVVVFTVTRRFRLNLYILFLSTLAIFAVLGQGLYTGITIYPGLPQGLQMDSLLRDSYIISPILYYLLLPIGFALSVFFALLPILFALIKNIYYMAPRLHRTGFGSMFLLLVAVISAVAAFVVEGSYDVLCALSLLCGAISGARMFAFKGFAVKITVSAAIAVGVVNLCFMVFFGITTQFMSFGYIDYPEQQMMDTMFLKTAEYIRHNTPNNAIVATNHPLGDAVTSALSNRQSVSLEQEFYSTAVSTETMEKQHVDYLLLYNRDKNIYDDFTILYENGGYVVAAR